MKKLLLLALLIPTLGQAQGIVRNAPDAERLIGALRIGAAIGGSTNYSGYIVGNQPVSVAAVTWTVSVIGGVTSGNSGFRVTDGTNHCDCIVPCATTGSGGTGDIGTKRKLCTGTCTFPPGTVLQYNSNSTCNSTQPTVVYAYIWAK